MEQSLALAKIFIQTLTFKLENKYFLKIDFGIS